MAKTKERKYYTEEEVKILIEQAYNKGLNYAYYCMVAKPTDAEMSKAKQLFLEKVLTIPEKKIIK